MPHSGLLADCGTDNLKLGEQLLLWSLRSWVAATREGRCALCEIAEPFALIKAEPVAEAMHRTFLLLLRPTNRGIRVHYPRCGTIGEEESRILLAAGAAYHCDESLAGRLLAGSFRPDTAATLASAFKNGVLLCNLVDRLRLTDDAGWAVGLYPRARTRATSLANLEKALALVFVRTEVPVRSRPTAAEVRCCGGACV